MEFGCNQVTVGGSFPNAGNKIAFNSAYGVGVLSASDDQVLISENSIYCNVGKGIDLNSVGNNNNPAPVITSGNGFGCSGTALANQTIELYYDSSCTANCQSKTYIGSTVASAGGMWSYSGTINGTITATATDASNNTSEFSNCFTVTCTPTTATVTDTACNFYSSPSGNYLWTMSGSYQDTLVNTSGCDSVITFNLTINYSTADTIAPVACDSFVSPSGNVWTVSGAYTDIIPNMAGCDSVITINLTVNQSSSSIMSDTACDNYVWTINGLTYSSSGTYIDTISNMAGCDSVVTLNLTINNSSGTSLSDTACGSYTWSQNGQTYTSSGAYTDTLVNASGCDSLITLNLVINSATSFVETEVACDSFTWSHTGLTYTVSGTYEDTLVNAVGCDSIVTLNLTINTVDVSVTNTSPTLTANATGAQYQWLDCDNGFMPLAGETAQSFTATSNGNYAVEVTENGCTDTSACEAVTNLSVIDHGISDLIKVYPNPTDGTAWIEITNQLGITRIRIRNALGQVVLSEIFETNPMMIDIPGKSGIYFVEVIGEDGITSHHRVVKR